MLISAVSTCICYNDFVYLNLSLTISVTVSSNYYFFPSVLYNLLILAPNEKSYIREIHTLFFPYKIHRYGLFWQFHVTKIPHLMSGLFNSNFRKETVMRRILSSLCGDVMWLCGKLLSFNFAGWKLQHISCWFNWIHSALVQ